MTPIIEFKDYTFKYRSQVEPTLYNIDLAVYPGEKVLIVGPSGSGKSTLAHCINGLVPFSFPGESSGTLTVGGQDPSKAGIFGMSKLVGTVLQDTDGQFIGLTVAEDIAFALENDCVEQAEMFSKVDEVAEIVDVKTLLSHAPTELSGGQKQRVSMAGVMIDDVDILLFDEPLANLDPATGKKAIDLIDKISRTTGKTVLIIEHRLEDALYRDVDRIVVVGDGRIVADRKPDELLCTDILEKEGIREPLYITALKHAGCEILQETHPQHIESMDLALIRKRYRHGSGKPSCLRPVPARNRHWRFWIWIFPILREAPCCGILILKSEKGKCSALWEKTARARVLFPILCADLSARTGEAYCWAARIFHLNP